LSTSHNPPPFNSFQTILPKPPNVCQQLTHGQSGTSIPTGPLEALTKAHASNIRFLDFEFKNQGKEAIADTLEKICHARLIQVAIDDYVQERM